MQSAGIKVKIKCLNENLCTRENLLSICYKNKLKIESIFKLNQDFVVKFSNGSEAEQLFQHPLKDQLHDVQFRPSLPPELKANRTIFIRRVDNEILKNSENDICAEIKRCNEWCNIVELTKFKTCLKITFESVHMANKSIDNGLFLYYLHIPSNAIALEEFIRLNTCFNCYAVDNHPTRECPRKRANPDFQVCSNCSSTDHVFKNCSRGPQEFKCVNCSESHHSLAMKCSVRRQAIKNRRLGNNNKFSYSSIAKSPNPPLIAVDPDIIKKSISISVLATLSSNNNPKKFGEVFNSLMSDNNLPTLILDNYVPPTRISLQHM